MQKTRKKKTRKHNILPVFFLTFSLVIVLGLGGILTFRLLDNGNGEEAQSTMAGNQYREEVPENAGGREAIPGVKDSDTDSLEDAPLIRGEKQPEEPLDSGKYADILRDENYLKENRIYPKEGAEPEQVSLGFGGDILFDPGYSVMAKMLQRAEGIYDSIDPLLMEEMHQVDIMMLNNEFPYSSGGSPTPEKQFTFRAKPESAVLLEDMGVDIVSIANNHAYDFGERAFLDTLSTLKELQMPFVGGGENIKEASAPVYFIVNDIKIGIVSATQIERMENPDTKGATEMSAGVFRCLNPAKLLEVIEETKKQCDFVIVYVHWGTENVAEPDWAQLDQAPKMVSAGADLIIGDHPHCLQPIEFIDGVPVIYSVGNFWFNSKEVDTCLIKTIFTDEGLLSVQFLPALQKDSKTGLLQGNEKDRVLQYMRGISPKVLIDEEGFVTPKT